MIESQKNIVVLGSTIAKLIWNDQAKRMAEKGYRTFFFVREKTEFSPETNHIQTVEIPGNIFLHWIRFYKLIKAVRPHHIEAYHDLHRWDFLLSYWVYVWLAKMFRIPIISICMGGEILYWKQHFFLKKWSVKTLLKASKVIIVKEPYHEEYIRSFNILGRKKVRIEAIPNAVDVRERSGFERSKDVLLYLNSFKSWRHPEVVIRAFKIVKQKCPQAKLIMAGYRTADELSFVKEELNQDILPSVSFIPYDLENRAYFAQAKIFILPAELVYLNNSLLEAMERGVPAIIGNRDPHGEKIIQNGKNGFIVDISPEAIAEHVVLLLENEQLRQEMGRKARQTVIERFNNENRIDKLISIYISF